MHINLFTHVTDFFDDLRDDTREYFAWNKWKEDLGFFYTLLAIIITKIFFFNINLIPSGSMNPTFVEGDIVLVNKVKHWFEPIKRGDIITFDRDEYMVKRVIALGGDTVQMIKGQLYLNGALVQYSPLKSGNAANMGFPLADKLIFDAYEVSLENGDPFNIVLPQKKQPHYKTQAILNKYLLKNENRLLNTEKLKVPEGYLFVMGDNQLFSLDSRAKRVGLVRVDEVVGSGVSVIFNKNTIFDFFDSK